MSAVPLWDVTLHLLPWPDTAESSVHLARSLVSGHRSFRGAPPFVADSLVRRRVLALALIFRGHLREARAVGRLDQAEGFFNPFIDLALIGGIPAETVLAVLRRAPKQGEFLGQGSALPWWAARHDTLSLKNFARRADSAATHVGGSPIARSCAGYLSGAAGAYLALARLDSAACARWFDGVAGLGMPGEPVLLPEVDPGTVIRCAEPGSGGSAGFR